MVDTTDLKSVDLIMIVRVQVPLPLIIIYIKVNLLCAFALIVNIL